MKSDTETLKEGETREKTRDQNKRTEYGIRRQEREDEL